MDAPLIVHSDAPLLCIAMISVNFTSKVNVMTPYLYPRKIKNAKMSLKFHSDKFNVKFELNKKFLG